MIKTKDKVLSILKEMQGIYISGQDIAEKIQVTRAAVWKAIKTLQTDGYEIDAVTNKGYRLRTVPDVINKEHIQAELAGAGVDIAVFHYEQVECTNDVAIEFAKERNGAALVIADSQTKGRGRRGRAFFSPENTGLYMSVSFCTDKNLAEFRNLTSMAASAVALAIDDVAFGGSDTTQIKWVNDVFLDERKVAGILTESYGSLEDGHNYIVIGIGINIYPPNEGFPKELKGIAGSVFSKAPDNGSVLRTEICAAVTRYLFSFMEDEGRQTGWFETYRSKSNLIGRYVKINKFQGNYEYARVTGISDKCELMVEYDDGKKGSLITGEVSVVKY